MFYSQLILSKKGPLGTIWIAAHLDRKLRKNQVTETNITVSVDSIIFPEVPIALRLSGHLLLGVVRIYSRKVNYLFQDCSEALVKIKQAFKPGQVDLPPEAATASFHQVTVPENFDLDEFYFLPELPFNIPAAGGSHVDQNVTTKETITLEDNSERGVWDVYGISSQIGAEETFGDGGGGGLQPLELEEEAEDAAAPSTAVQRELPEEAAAAPVPDGGAPLPEDEDGAAMEMDIEMERAAALGDVEKLRSAPIATENDWGGAGANNLFSEELLPTADDPMLMEDELADAGPQEKAGAALGLAEVTPMQEDEPPATPASLRQSGAGAEAEAEGLDALTPLRPSGVLPDLEAGGQPTPGAEADADAHAHAHALLGETPVELRVRSAPEHAAEEAEAPGAPTPTPTPTPAAAGDAPGRKAAVPRSVRKRKALVDATTVINAQAMREQLEDSAAILRTRRVAPHTRTEIRARQRRALGDAFFQLPATPGFPSALLEFYKRVARGELEGSGWAASRQPSPGVPPGGEGEGGGAAASEREAAGEPGERDEEGALQQTPGLALAAEEETALDGAAPAPPPPEPSAAPPSPLGAGEAAWRGQPDADIAAEGGGPLTPPLAEGSSPAPLEGSPGGAEPRGQPGLEPEPEPELQLEPEPEPEPGVAEAEAEAEEQAEGRALPEQLSYDKVYAEGLDFLQRDTRDSALYLGEEGMEDDVEEEPAGTTVADKDKVGGWSARTRAVGMYLKTTFDGLGAAKALECQDAALVPKLGLDNMLGGKSRREAARLFFEILVLKTRDFVDVEQQHPYNNIWVAPCHRLMKSPL